MRIESNALASGELAKGAIQSGQAQGDYNTADQKLTIDPEQIREFCEALFANVTEAGYVQLRCFRDDKDGTALTPWPSARIDPEADDPTAELVEAAARMAQKAATAPYPVVFAPPWFCSVAAPKQRRRTFPEAGAQWWT